MFELFIFISFALILFYLAFNQRISDIALICIILFSVITGEALNLFVYRATAYTGHSGVPLFIIFAGALLGWAVFRLTLISVRLFNLRPIFVFPVFIFITLSAPLIEFLGVQSGLWYWLKPYEPFTFFSLIGVWKFYFIFVFLPVLPFLVITLDKIKR
jgi:hypothetical protein